MAGCDTIIQDQLNALGYFLWSFIFVTLGDRTVHMVHSNNISRVGLLWSPFMANTLSGKGLSVKVHIPFHYCYPHSITPITVETQVNLLVDPSSFRQHFILTSLESHYIIDMWFDSSVWHTSSISIYRDSPMFLMHPVVDVIRHINTNRFTFNNSCVIGEARVNSLLETISNVPITLRLWDSPLSSSSCFSLGLCRSTTTYIPNIYVLLNVLVQLARPL